jgi:hypothetical protein
LLNGPGGTGLKCTGSTIQYLWYYNQALFPLFTGIIFVEMVPPPRISSGFSSTFSEPDGSGEQTKKK